MFHLIGINFKTSPFYLLEKINMTTKEKYNIYNSISFDEKVILFTCNRRELIFYNKEKIFAEKLKEFFLNVFLKNNDIKKLYYDKLYIYYNTEVIFHLFKVASGIESAIIGENQILKQMKDAYRYALENNFTRGHLNRLFQRAFYVGKKIRSLTNISKGNVSIATVVLGLINNNLNIKFDKILIIGTGDVSQLFLKYLKEKNIKKILLAGRNYKKAIELSKKFQVIPEHIKNLKDLINEVNIIITATSAPHYIIDTEFKISNLLKKRKKALYIFDLGVPRDVNPDLKLLNEKIFIYDMDYINNILIDNIKRKQKEKNEIENIIKKEVEKYEDIYYRNSWQFVSIKTS